MKAVAVAVFVKTPTLSPVKTRLAAGMGREFAEEFYLRSLRVTKSVVTEAVKAMPEFVPYWAVAEEEGLGHPLWQSFDRVYQGEGGLGERLSRVYDTLSQRHEVVIFVGADSPLLGPSHLTEALGALIKPDASFVIGRALDGGFYLFGGSRPVPKSAWTSVEYSAASTAEQLVSALGPIGAVAELEKLPDVDTVNDLALLQREGRGLPLLACQKELLTWLSSVRGYKSD